MLQGCLSVLSPRYMLLRYLPQMWLNHKRRSTAGWNVSNALTDMSGGLFSLSQQILDAYALKVRCSLIILCVDNCAHTHVYMEADGLHDLEPPVAGRGV